MERSRTTPAFRQRGVAWGGILADGQAAATVSGLLERNVAGGYGGGAAAFVQAVVNLSAGARLYENRAGGSGGCVYAGGGPSSVGEFPVR